VHDLFEDELFSDILTLYPQQRYVRNPNGGVMRMWEENSSGDDWWNIQVSYYVRNVTRIATDPFKTKLGNETFVIYLQIYVDSTHVTSFGNVKYWGVYLWVGNVPKADRNDRGGRGRAMLIAYLPSVSKISVFLSIFLILILFN
jgi:hypothetical protein